MSACSGLRPEPIRTDVMTRGRVNVQSPLREKASGLEFFFVTRLELLFDIYGS